MTFAGQSMPDIQQKLQKLEGLLTCPISHLVEVAYTVFVSREQTKEKQKEKRKVSEMRQQAKLLAVVLTENSTGSSQQGPPPHRGKKIKRKNPLKKGPMIPKDLMSGKTKQNKKDQCAYCEDMGPWRKNCPKLQQKSDGNLLCIGWG